MRPINLKHLIIAKQSLPDSLCGAITSNWGVCPKPAEYTSLSSFIGKLKELDSPFDDHLFQLLDDCYFGFKIPQISKEFDCLWIGENEIINIELKSGFKPEEDIKKQLRQNRYYLGPLKKNVQSFTYVSSTHTCYQLDMSGEVLSTIELTEVAKALYQIHKTQLYRDEIENLFHPEDYLVSPFNSTEAFLKGEYFLTSQQDEIKKKIISAINNPAGPSILAISGGPGSGKTLLLYDIAYSLMRAGKKVIIGHGGGLNQGQMHLNAAGWDIRPTKGLFTIDFDIVSMEGEQVPVGDADVYLIDESQRSPDVLWVMSEVNMKGKKCIFAFDKNQCLKEKEFERNNEAKIVSSTGSHFVFRLTSSVRTNEAVCEFVDALFDLNKEVHKDIRNNVDVVYCDNVSQVLSTFEMLREKGCVVPRFTPNASANYLRNDYEDWFLPTGPSAHEVIGQEFDEIVGLISPNMLYTPEGKLVSCKSYYYIEDRMLYQILSRARKKIHLIVFDNQLLLSRCLELLN